MSLKDLLSSLDDNLKVIVVVDASHTFHDVDYAKETKMINCDVEIIDAKNSFEWLEFEKRMASIKKSNKISVYDGAAIYFNILGSNQFKRIGLYSRDTVLSLLGEN